MFTKVDGDEQPDMASPPKIGQAPPIRSKNVSVIGPTLVFKGELSADEDLIIDGHIEGTIAHHDKHLTVGKQGRVKADIHASSVIIMGRLEGNIHCEGVVSLSKDSIVKGDIFCGRIVMEDGARFMGRIDMGQAPKLAATKQAPQGEPLRAEKRPA